MMNPVRVRMQARSPDEPIGEFLLEEDDIPAVSGEDLPIDAAVQMIQDGRRVSFHVDEWESLIIPENIAPKSELAFLTELEGILHELRAQGFVDGFPPAEKLWYESSERRIRRKVAGFITTALGARRLIREHNLRTAERRARFVERVTGAKRNWSKDELSSIMRNLAALRFIHELNPELGIWDKLKDESVGFSLGIGEMSFLADRLLPHIQSDSIRVKWEDDILQSVARCLNEMTPQFYVVHYNDLTRITVSIHPVWSKDDDEITVRLSMDSWLVETYTPFVGYALDDKGNLLSLGMNGTLPVSWDCPMDIKTDPHREWQLYVPIPEVESLDMMLGTPIPFRHYFHYAGTGYTLYPVRVKLPDPISAMFVLDRLATMLTSGVSLKDVELWIDDGEGGKFKRDYTHPWTLASLIMQILLQQHQPRTLNELAFRLLSMVKTWNPPESHPWESVTIDGYWDVLSAGSKCQADGKPPILSRSHPTLEEYIKERQVLCTILQLPSLGLHPRH